MFNAMKYIRDLEAAGFERNQAEAQVQMVLDAIEGEMVTKNDFKIFEERMENRFNNRFDAIDDRFNGIEKQFNGVALQFNNVDKRFVEFELRIITRLGFLMVSTTSIAVAFLAWLIKLHA